MKVIDLLNKIANGEEVPKKILILDKVYYLIKDEDGDIVYSQLKDRREWESFIDRKLNITRCLHEDVIILDEVEIIEEQEDIDIQDINNRLKRLENMVDRFEYIEKRVETIDSQSGIFRYC